MIWFGFGRFLWSAVFSVRAVGSPFVASGPFLVVGTEIPYCLGRFLTKARLSPYHLGWSSAGDAPSHRAGSPFLTLVVDEHHQGELTFLFPSCYGANLSTRTLTSYLVICVQI